MSDLDVTVLDRPAQNWINGEWSADGAVLESISPSTGEVLGHYVDASAEESQRSINAAREAFSATDWAKDRSLRSRALLEMADRLQGIAPELALMLAREGGKLHMQTQWEVRLSIEWLRYAAASALLQTDGRALEVSPGVHFHSAREPMGVVGVISPWNSPVILSVRAIGPALAAGCTVVLKLPHQTALTNALFSKAMAETKLLPPGVLNIITETGSIGASLLVESPEVNAISYTGSTKIGRLIGANGSRTLKRINLELGGKTPLIVFDDADLNLVVPQIIMACVLMNGQYCCTGSRILVQRGIADRLRAALIEAYQNIRLGHSDDPDAQLGPLVDKDSVRRLDEQVAAAEGYAKILVRGGPVTEGPLASGAFFRPALIEVQDLDTYVVQNELFGPVQTFELFDDEADAIHRANATEFGLAASIYTADASRARRVGKGVEAGHIWINCWAVLSEHFEQSGYKQSGIGALCGPQAIQEFQELKIYATVDAPSPGA
ncbi:aldehyde dehydrogenase family protein [Sphingobium chlorophenolicum]|uniref:Aldehyde dehydrogenase (Acceptor) n=1 Tax=Sphingobium chlorophenolicum TaxID=46429 RepID=A0A081RFE3_SPHCR|nr:aldehyde dehydrogenase family protein [Sphingobium chlorophenolicum]KEQ53916.1 Aldehyde dehydrogenase (Acceptor) [Sphingobium chlorophenolicum]